MIDQNRIEPNRNEAGSNVKSVVSGQKRGADAHQEPLIDKNRYEEIVRRVGVPRRRRKRIDIAFALEMRRLGFSNDQLALYFHCSVSTIRRRLRAARRQ